MSSVPVRPISATLRAVLLLGAALFQLTTATGSRSFSSCLPKWVTHVHAGQVAYANLTQLSFVNDRYTPLFIVLARTSADVAHAVRCARRVGLRVCARSGGHSFVGKSLCPGVMIDVGAIQHVRVNRRNKVAAIGPGAIMGEVLWKLHQYRRWMPGTASPAVGAAGYILGGGRGLYGGAIGLACDLLVEVTMVTRKGQIVKASRWRRSELFWAMCGAGGGQFGVVTEFKVRTVPSAPFDHTVVFRYNWPREKVGELVSKWLPYKEDGGSVRVTLGMGLEKGESGMFAEGACFSVHSVAECENRLKKAAFFNVAGRNATLIFKANDAVEMHAFQGPSGGWGRRRVANVREALLGHQYEDAGSGNERTFHSPYMKKIPTSPEFWQRYANFCANPGLESIPWIVCELFLVQNAGSQKRNNAFPHRDNVLLQHYIIGGGTKEERAKAYTWMSNTFKPYRTGVYVNYPELELKNYAKMYWGKNLCRLRRLKTKYDPDVFFFNSQPIPPMAQKGFGHCSPRNIWRESWPFLWRIMNKYKKSSK